MLRVRDKLRAVARKGWMGSGNAFDSVVTTRPCFKSTRPPRVGNAARPPLPPLMAPISIRPPCFPYKICVSYLPLTPARQPTRKGGEAFRLSNNSLCHIRKDRYLKQYTMGLVFPDLAITAGRVPKKLLQVRE